MNWPLLSPKCPMAASPMGYIICPMLPGGLDPVTRVAFGQLFVLCVNKFFRQGNLLTHTMFRGVWKCAAVCTALCVNKFYPLGMRDGFSRD